MRTHKKWISLLLAGTLLFAPAATVYAYPETEETEASEASETEEKSGTSENDTESGDTEGTESTEAEAEPKDTVQIKTVEDLLTVAESCRLDSWSANRRVELTADLTIPYDEDCFIPSFSGTFDGQGHLIDGLSITGPRANTGLFGTLTESGTITNLKVAGSIKPEGTQQRLGGIVGINNGTIENCSFSGDVDGDSEIGGIAGRNNGNGVIAGCRAEGTVTGNHFTGGIAGYNEGNIWSCTNNTAVNTSYADVPFSSEQLLTRLEQFLMTGKANTLQSVNSRMDLGGITGFSAGIINGCTNNGDVGYEHTGYNVGGIAGRSAGLIVYCTNTGFIQGRKDTGGIAGQLQPFMEADFSSMVMENIDTELDVLHAQVNEALEDAGRYSADTTERLSRISGFAGAAKDSLSAINAAAHARADELIEKGKQVAAEVGTTATAFEASHNEISRIVGELEPVLGALAGSFSWTDADVETIMAELGLNENEQHSFREGVANIRTGLAEINEGKQMLLDARTALAQELANEGGIAGIFQKLVSGHFDTTTGQYVFDNPDYKSTWSAIIEGYTNGVSKIRNGVALAAGGADTVLKIMKKHDDFKADKGSLASRFYQDIRALAEQLSSVEALIAAIPALAAELRKPLESLNGVQAALAANPIAPVSEETRQAEQNLYGALTSVKSEMDALNSAVNSSAQESVGSFQAINDEVNKIMHLVEDAFREAQGVEPDPEEHIEELTDEEIENSNEGHIKESQNKGEIAADLNSGGIVGSMAVEYDLDPEEDISTSGDTALDYVLRIRCIINNSKNEGKVRSRNSCAGGICARMELGIVKDCENVGSIKAGSDYCGGIAGYSNSEIRSSTSRSELSGTRYVGGIAGFANILKNNSAMVNISDATQFTGAIAGFVNETGEDKLVANRFYSETLYGIDGVNYEGKADAVSYSELFSGDTNLPLVLTFVAEDEVVDEVTVPYGKAVPEEEIPAVPEREGFYGSWSREDFGKILSDEVIEAVYTRTRALLSSTLGPDGVAKALLEGNYYGDETFSMIAETPVGEETERWHLVFPEDMSVPQQIRFLAPEKSDVMLVQNGTYGPAATESFGKYKLLTVDSNEVTIAVLPAKDNKTLIIICAASAAAVLVLILILVHVRKKKKAKTA